MFWHQFDTIVEHVAPFVSALNLLLVTRRTGEAIPYPPGGITHRGGGFRAEHKNFFTVGKAYRVPGLLATSFSEDKAYEFIGRACSRGEPPVHWKIHQVC